MWSPSQRLARDCPSARLARSRIGIGAPAAARAATTPYVPGTVIVGYKDGSAHAARIASASGGTEAPVRVLHLPAGTNLQRALERLRSDRDVSFAVPDYIARASTVSAGGSAPSTIVPPAPFIPENFGSTNTPGGWQALQWNFEGAESVEAPQAWGNLIADHAEGGRGVIVAVLDTGIAYRNWKRFRRSPGFDASQFVRGKDFVNPGQPPVDHNGHGTFVAGEIAEATNVRYGLTGLAYGVRLMPVRVLDSAGEGDALTIAQGIRYAVDHHAQIINLSLEFPAAISAADVPELTQALRYADQRHVLVVAAAGNDSDEAIPYPARAPGRRCCGRIDRTRLPRGLLELRSPHRDRRPRRRPRCGSSRRSRMPTRTRPGARRLPGHLPRHLPAPLRPATRLRRHLDGDTRGRCDGGARHRLRRPRQASHARGASRRA